MHKTSKIFLITLASIIFLTACGQNWVVDVDLSDEQRAEYEQQLKENDELIKNYKPESEESSPYAPFDAYIDKAKAQTYLGYLGDAVKTYKEALKFYPQSRAIENNLGRIYEQVGEYELAIQQYQYMVDHFNDSGYLYDITWVYIKIKDRKNAEKYFNAWQLAFQTTDEQTQQAIKKLREEEKNN